MTAGPTPDRPSDRLAETLAALTAAGFEEAEVFTKRGRSRRLALALGATVAAFHQERGWAVRAGTRRGSFFAAGTGEPPPHGARNGPWPEPDGRPLRLPEAQPVPAWTEPAEFEAPLLGEGEGLRLLASLERALAGELAGARLASATLEDGSSEQELASRRGISARVRHRLASLRADATVRLDGRTVQATVAVAAREARRLDVPALARRLADRLAAAAGAPPERDRGEMLAAPAVGFRLLTGLLPLLVGPAGSALAEALRGRDGRLGSEALTVIDDGRLAGGVLAAPVDGEGLPTRECALIEAGVYRQPLLAWHEVRGPAERASGCRRRASWRDLPRSGPTHLFVRPQPVAVAELLGGIGRGYYLLDAAGAARFDFTADRFALPVVGFAVASGRAVAPVAGATLTGGIGTLLTGLAAVGRDLTFVPGDGLIGTPTLLLTGLELRKE